ncbi:MAG: hypothetical protein F6K08_16580, partial [Okeania sp. SIO1H6]|nr:hypothetical protein [Okeania sp. SIO1H6]
LYNVRKSSDELSEPILWIVNSADLLVKYFPKKRPIKELALQKFDLFDPIPSDNAIEPIIKTLKEGVLKHNTMIISGQSFFPKHYGLLACGLSNFSFSLWIGKNNIELVIRKFFKNKISLLKELDSFNQKCFPVLAVTSTGEFILENYE